MRLIVFSQHHFFHRVVWNVWTGNRDQGGYWARGLPGGVSIEGKGSQLPATLFSIFLN